MAGTGRSGPPGSPETRLQLFQDHFTWFWCLLALCLFITGLIRVRDEAGSATAGEQLLRWSGPARFAILAAISLLLCKQLCSIGSQFGQSWTFSPLHNAEAGFGFVSFFTTAVYAMTASIVTLKVAFARRGRRRGPPGLQ